MINSMWNRRNANTKTQKHRIFNYEIQSQSQTDMHTSKSGTWVRDGWKAVVLFCSQAIFGLTVAFTRTHYFTLICNACWKQRYIIFMFSAGSTSGNLQATRISNILPNHTFFWPTLMYPMWRFSKNKKIRKPVQFGKDCDFNELVLLWYMLKEEVFFVGHGLKHVRNFECPATSIAASQARFYCLRWKWIVHYTKCNQQ